MKVDECADCAFFFGLSQLGGYCRRHPPQLFIMPPRFAGEAPNYEQAHPNVSKRDWCGEFVKFEKQEKNDG